MALFILKQETPPGSSRSRMMLRAESLISCLTKLIANAVRVSCGTGREKLCNVTGISPFNLRKRGGDQRRVAVGAAKKQGMKMGRKEKKEARRRMRRRDNGMASTAGISSAPKVEPITRTLALLSAALRAWEARNEHLRSRSVWRRRVNGEATEI
jgi:hypothetical protein